MIELKNISKRFDEGTINETVLFDDFNLHIKKGQFVSVVGSNGSGKTTLLSIISGGISPDSGKIILDGKDITFTKEHIRQKRIGRVLQNPLKNVASNMTIAENLSLAENKGKYYGLKFSINSKNKERYKEMVSKVGLGLENKIDVKTGLLSGGQRQAVSLITSTLTPIDILILDEHTAALDPKTADIVMKITDEIVKEKGITALMVTHNLRYAVEYGNRLVMMDKGKIIVDKSDDEKKKIQTDDLIKTFNEISIECGN